MRNQSLQRRARTLRIQTTDAERHLWRRLRRSQISGYRFRRQAPIADYIADFACLEAKLVIELDGGQHAEHKVRDEVRDHRIEAQGFRVLRFWDNEVFRETEAVLERILQALEGHRPHPDPPPQAEEGSPVRKHGAHSDPVARAVNAISIAEEPSHPDPAALRVCPGKREPGREEEGRESFSVIHGSDYA